ncbi:FecR family protein [Maribellus sediminis]|uniref:FecR family protein n=1 Tax=Maribellus sediminis TaxID=2696285 RepID=UPI001431AF6A|nr:FecR family protein [Maribellus sediminis]
MGKNTFDKDYLTYLISRKIEGTIEPEELRELNSWSEKSEENAMWLADFEGPDYIRESLTSFDSFDEEAAWQRLDASIVKEEKQQPRRIAMWIKVAAVLVLALFSGSTFYFIKNTDRNPLAGIIADDVKPGVTNAYLVVDENSQISLTNDSSRVVVADQLIASVDQGTLHYESDIKQLPKQHHRIVVPEKSEYHFTLPDGSRVWLNAGSSLEYDVPFADSARNLTLQGEMYIEVQKMSGKRMSIDTHYGKVVVTGTQFNLQAYSNEEKVVTTLAEGSVIYVTKTGLERMIQPGQQISVDKTTNDIEVSDVDPGMYASWKDGRLVVDAESLDKIMRNLSRWYGINYQFESERLKDIKYSINVEKYENLSSILELIEATGKVKFTIEDNTVTVNINNS